MQSFLVWLPKIINHSFWWISFWVAQKWLFSAGKFLHRCIYKSLHGFIFLENFVKINSEKITPVLSSVICVFIPLWIFISSSEKYLGFEMSPNVTQNVTVRLALCQFLTFKWNHVEHPNSNIWIFNRKYHN